jgi:hypothetical protein
MSRTDRWVPFIPAALLVAALVLLSGPLLKGLKAAEPHPSSATVEQMMAGLSDEQVRQLLIDELKSEIQAEEYPPEKMKGPAVLLSRLLLLMSSQHDNSEDEVRAMFSSLPTLGPDLYRIFVKL